jgi:tripartite ATP-independent transporter DctM subunit
MPIGIIIFLVIGVILLGIATPSEAAATGALAILVMAFFQKRLNKEVLKKSLSGTLLMTGMIFLIIAGATAFSQILSYTGATRGLSGLAIGLPVHPLFIFVGMQVVIMILGCFINVDAIILLTIPIFIPIVSALGFDRVWFGTIVLVNLEMALITPPFGMSLFVMKGVSLPGTTMRDVYNASFPIVCLHIMVMAILMFFPKIVLWLPGLM